MKLLLFWVDWTVRVVLKISLILLDYPNFVGVFLYAFMVKTSTKLEFLYVINCSFCTKKFINNRSEKTL